jgi:hypothetical protein
MRVTRFRLTRFRLLWPLLVIFAGCECAPFGLDDTRFVCTTQADCAEGFECRDVGAGLECVGVGTGEDEGGLDDDAGADAGEPVAGEPDAGEADAGEPDAGEPDAGEADSGVDAGAQDAGTDAGTDAGQAGTPTALRFATAPQSIPSNGCS